MNRLPGVGRLSVTLVLLTAGLMLVVRLPFARTDHPFLLIALFLLSSYFLLNNGLVATAIALTPRERTHAVWQASFLWSAPTYVIGAGVASAGAWWVTHAAYWIAPLMFAPAYLTYRTYRLYKGRLVDQQRRVQQSSDLQLATLEALARAIDAKDQTTHLHIRRVQLYATGLARAVGVSPADIQGIGTAALLHDIGKLAVPEHILSKPGPLTHEEFQKVRIHPQIGADIIASIPFPYTVAPLILNHHERWDGKGYPQGLAGEEIPLGARILTIADYYEAVTSDRPYHKALSSESAVALMRHEAGRALDPSLVVTFVRLLPELRAQAAAQEREYVTFQPSALLKSGGASEGAPASTSAFENIALAHREIYALYEIAQSMGTSLGVSDTMALISSKLAKIVPWNGCSVFLYHPETNLLKCRFGSGLDAEQLLNTTVTLGHGAVGWVARNRRTLMNADPRIIFQAAGIDASSALRSAIVCPLYDNDTLIGCLALYHTEANRYTDDHRRLIERICEQAGPVLHNSILFEQTQEDSLTDPLTGLPNRRSMFAHLSAELARAERARTEVGLIVMDLDRFKAINDTYGHNVGDFALRQVAATLKASLRPYDLCIRYAGDEFIVVLAECSLEMAEAKRRELQLQIAQIAFEVRPGKLVQLGVSAGASVFPADGETFETLLTVADRRMYQDKAVRRRDLGFNSTPSPDGTLGDEPPSHEQEIAKC